MKKQVKKVTKTTVKNTKKNLVVDLYKVDAIEDLYFNFALGKNNAGIPITDYEFTAIYKRGLNDAYEVTLQVINSFNAVNKIVNDLSTKNVKTPWYKKLWNKITSPFRKNK